jgi:50S ribosomal protein L16 3-hydroxylase
VLTEPKALVWFEAGEPLLEGQAACLDRRSRMMYDDRTVYINGESFRAGGRDAKLMQALADRRRLSTSELGRLSPEARELLDEWVLNGWLRGEA